MSSLRSGVTVRWLIPGKGSHSSIALKLFLVLAEVHELNSVSPCNVNAMPPPAITVYDHR